MAWGHSGLPNWQTTAMTWDGAASAWELNVNVPEAATALDFAFTDGTNWDNNGDADWHYATVAAPPPAALPAITYVDATAAAGGDGSSAHPFVTIQTAINAAAADSEILIYPGVYRERLAVTKNLTLRSHAGPQETRIVAEGVGSGDLSAITVTPGINASFKALTIEGGANGISLETSGSIEALNCIIHGSAFAGIRLDCTSQTLAPSASIVNCVIGEYGRAGIYLGDHSFSSCVVQRRYPNLVLIDTVLNAGSGIWGIETESNTLGSSGCGFEILHGSITIDRVDAFGNSSGAYTPLLTSNHLFSDIPVAPGGGCFEADPLFVGDFGNLDLRLAPDSPCRGAGSGGGDIGAFGGAGAASFTSYPSDGPVIRNVVVEPAYVDPEGTFTIRAVGAVR
jgi:hypothetical protein